MTDAVYADDGCKLWAQRLGAGPPLVLCHGGPGLWDTFTDLGDRLAGVARVVRWDQRGCGRSDRRGPYTVARTMADLDAVREQLAGPRMVLLGHSFGATLALRYALAHPDRVSALIYVSGTGIDAERAWNPVYQRNLRTGLGTRLARWEELDSRDRTPDEDREWAILQWSADFADRDRAPRLAERMATPWLGINYDCHAGLSADDKRYLRTTDVAAQCRTLTVPTLILHGDRDIRPTSAVDSLHRALPNSTLVTLAGVGHVPWLEAADQFSAAVTDFMVRSGQ
ncbi:alpha/beta fold hydrolase [Virgisporangium aurantiacum]|nr:alpha/beta hydrolase [Virgisporangium aurantiacum]